ncbi:hypothetical protein, partial [Aeromonas caviae]|uniref:hypothetical protein n=1 Tax=Aeromonas caviae TaxID=648 RepID=UPI001FC8AFB5
MGILNFLITDRDILHFSVITRRFQGSQRTKWRHLLPFTAWGGHETGFLGGIRCYKHRGCDFTHFYGQRQSFFRRVDMTRLSTGRRRYPPNPLSILEG